MKGLSLGRHYPTTVSMGSSGYRSQPTHPARVAMQLVHVDGIYSGRCRGSRSRGRKQ